jgi:uncharacterized repeat protein (TIGR03803 family)
MTSKIPPATYATLLLLAGLAASPRPAAAQPKAPHFTTLYHFTQSKNGEGDVEGALTAVDGVLYGAAGAGGSAGLGTVFRLDLSTLAETTLTSFTGGKKQGAAPFGPLTHVGAAVYGSTTEGYGTGPGSNGNYTGYGTIWRLNTHSGKIRVFHGFDGTDGSQPYSGVTPTGGVFYGATWYGGPGNAGTVFELDASGKLTQLYTFPDSTIGCNPLDAVTVVGNMLYGTTTFCGAGGSGTVFALDLDSGQASLLHSFAANPNGSAEPNALVYQNGVLYGTTFADGGAGDVYTIDVQTGQYAVVHQFSGGNDGGTPTAGLTPLNGLLFGVTEGGGTAGHGTIYSIDPATGTETVVYSFTAGSDGDSPFGGLVAYKNALYGSTLNIDSEYPDPRGSLFKFVP